MKKTHESVLCLRCLLLTALLVGCDQQQLSTPAATSSLDTTSEAYKMQRQWIDVTLAEAQQTPPKGELSDVIIDYVLRSNNEVIRTRAMLILPYIQEREKAIDALIQCLEVREIPADQACLLQPYAATILGQMRAVEALPSLKAWQTFLEQDTRLIAASRAQCLSSVREIVKDLETSASTRPTK